jgi:dolichol-phosphate mannosyltransferase
MNEINAISIIFPVYNEEKGIYKNTLRVHKILEENNILHQFIIVDDGSSDNSWEEIKKLQNEVKLKAYRFSRNFGKESALMAAIDHVDTSGCVIIDSDLQHPPEVIIEMVKKWQEEGFEIIEGVKAQRGKESIVNKIGARIFYSLFSKLSGFDLRNASDFKFFDKRALEALKRMPEVQPFFRGLSAWIGFKRTEIVFEVQEREVGNSKCNFFGLFKLALLAITSFSSIPLHIVTFMGLLFLGGSVILGIQTLYMKFSGLAVSGFTTVILLLLIIGSTLMISLGVIGIYIEKIFNEIKGRPRYIISEETEHRSQKTE